MNRVILVGLVVFAAICGMVSAQAPAIPDKIDELEAATKLIAEGRLDEAIKKIDEAAKKHPHLPPAKVLLARTVVKVVPGQARTFLEQAAIEAPNHPEVYLLLGELAVTEGRATEAIFDGTKALELIGAGQLTAEQKTGYSKTAHRVLATAYEQRRDWNNAKTQFASWLEMDPKNGAGRQRYATVLFKLNQVDDAFKEYQAAAKDDPSLLSAHVQMALQYMERRDNARSMQHFERAVATDPNNARAHLAFVEFLLGRGDLDNAKLHTEVAVRLDPKSSEVRSAQAVIARISRDYATAEKVFHELMTENPDNWAASNQLALVLAESSDAAKRKRGLGIAESNYGKSPRSLEFAATLAYCQARNGNMPQAKQILKPLLQAVRNPRPDIAYIIAMVMGDEPAHVEDAKALLKGAMIGTDVFFYRPEAQELLQRLDQKR